MDKATEINFKSTLVKNLQYLCAGLVPFHSNIEIIGHIFMRVDNSNKYNYFLEEIIAKTELHGTLLSSKTFSAKPDSSDIVISNIHPGFSDQQLTTNTTNLELEDLTKSSPVSVQMPATRMVQVPMPVSGSEQVQLSGVVHMPVSRSGQIPLSGMVQMPASENLSVPEWLPTVQIQNVTSLAPGAHQGLNNINSIPLSEINIQLAKSGASISDTVFHENVIQEQRNQVKIPSENTSQSASDILKVVNNMKKEPKEDVEYRTLSPHTLAQPDIPASSHITVPPLPSTSQVGQKKKRKTSHATRIELEPFINKEAESGKMKPRIIKSRSVPKKPKPVVTDVDEGSQSSSGDFVDVPVHFGELTPESTTEEDEVFPVSMLKNLSGFEEACNQSVAILSQNQAMKKAFQDPKKRGTYNFYTEAEKKKAINLAGEFGVTAICQRFAIPLSTLWSWKKAYEKTQNPEIPIENVKEEEQTEEKIDIKNLTLKRILSD